MKGKVTDSGLFIVFDGNDGSGKSTQVRLLEQNIWSIYNRHVRTTREPGGTSIGQTIRDQLLFDTGNNLDSSQQFVLFYADRILNIEKHIRPALDNKYDVICDRYVDSTLAYQIYGNGLSIKFMKDMNYLSKIIEPDLVIILYVDPEVGMQRVSKRGKPDNYEIKNMEFKQRVYDSFVNNQAFKKSHYLKIDTTVIEEQYVAQIIFEKYRELRNTLV